MAATVAELANLMKMKRADGEKFVLMLGAGASISSGVKSTPTIKAELLRANGVPYTDHSLDDQFDELWKRTTDDDRGRMLAPYLDQTPSPGYARLADLVAKGYFDLAISFNYDRLLEQALAAAEFDDVRTLIRGEQRDEIMQKLVDQKAPRFKLVKLHGSLRSANYFLFDIEEMHQYPPPIESLVATITRRDVLICGYAFRDICVIKAFANSGGAVFCVDPGGVPRDLRVAMKHRRSEGRVIPTTFDTFFEALHAELHREPGEAAADTPVINPFKFLESYEEADADLMLGRDEEAAHFFAALGNDPPPRVIVLAGPGKVGKTSLVRCKLRPQLDRATYEGVYVRCRPKAEESLPRELAGAAEANNAEASHPITLPEALRALADRHPDRHVVLFLDQFDRVASRFELQLLRGAKDFGAFLREHLFPGLVPNLTVVLVIADDGVLGGTLIQECTQQRIAASLVMCRAFDRAQVATIVQSIAARGGVEFDPRIIDELARSYEESHRGPATENRFTFAHIHAVCHILAGTRRVDYESYRSAFNRNLDALHRAINVNDIISFVDDFDFPHTVWMRNMIKVPLKESRDRIAEFIKAHYEDLMPRTNGGRRAPPGAGEEPAR